MGRGMIPPKIPPRPQPRPKLPPQLKTRGEIPKILNAPATKTISYSIQAGPGRARKPPGRERASDQAAAGLGRAAAGPGRAAKLIRMRSPVVQRILQSVTRAQRGVTCSFNDVLWSSCLIITVFLVTAL